MSVIKRVPQVLEIDIVLAGVEPGETVIEVPNPEGRDLIIAGLVWHATTFDSSGEDEAYIELSNHWGFFNSSWVRGPQASAFDKSAPSGAGDDRWVWYAGTSLVVRLGDFEGYAFTAPTYVGKLYIEYWAADAVELERVRAGYRRQFAAFPRA